MEGASARVEATSIHVSELVVGITLSLQRNAAVKSMDLMATTHNKQIKTFSANP